ncbi:hypothetical protein RJ640_024427 [Escallonia rubra]|uniref:60S ribosomal protein L18a-like protein n=1 Tax=Escallonia rubra TaxID=112253 RepID=A0AA88RRR8_9ASTE|nr:hypothetical protein RJ640_024427 [Escallonia rubra]
MSEEAKSRAAEHAVHPPPPPPEYYYGTFQGVANAQPPPPPSHPVTGYAVVQGSPLIEHRLPCCGIGIGWFLFIFGFFFGAIPWYIGAFILLCARVDYREKPGLIGCTLAATLAVIAITLGLTRAKNAW